MIFTLFEPGLGGIRPHGRRANTHQTYGGGSRAVDTTKLLTYSSPSLLIRRKWAPKEAGAVFV
jgi:hypothetical protein